VERSFPSPSPILGRAQAAATFPWARPATVCSRSGAAFHRHRQANRVLIFAGSDAVDALPPFVANAETLERGVIYGPGGLDTDVAFRRMPWPRGGTSPRAGSPGITRSQRAEL
jgi:hypothetical protein